MKTTAKAEEGGKGGATTRSAVVRLSNAIALEPYQSDLEFLTNMGLAKRADYDNAIAQSEIHRSYYSYTITMDLERVGVDGTIEISQEEKIKRVQTLLQGIQYLYRDIKGRRENLSPLFVIGGRYEVGLPFFENRLKVEKNNINVKTLKELLDDNSVIKEHTHTGVVSEIFDNDEMIKKELNATSVGKVFDVLKEEVKQYYEGN